MVVRRVVGDCGITADDGGVLKRIKGATALSGEVEVELVMLFVEVEALGEVELRLGVPVEGKACDPHRGEGEGDGREKGYHERFN